MSDWALAHDAGHSDPPTLALPGPFLFILRGARNGRQPRRPVPHEQLSQRLRILHSVTVQRSRLDNLFGAVCLGLAPNGSATVPTKERRDRLAAPGRRLKLLGLSFGQRETVTSDNHVGREYGAACLATVKTEAEGLDCVSDHSTRAGQFATDTHLGRDVARGLDADRAANATTFDHGAVSCGAFSGIR